MDKDDKNVAYEILFGVSDIYPTEEELKDKIKNLSMDDLKELESLVQDNLVKQNDEFHENVNFDYESIVENHIDRIVNRLTKLGSRRKCSCSEALNKVCNDILGRDCTYGDYYKINRAFLGQHGIYLESYFNDDVMEKSINDIDSNTVITSYETNDFKKSVKSPRIKRRTAKGYRNTRLSPVSGNTTSRSNDE